MAGTWGSQVSIERYRANVNFDNSWDYLEMVPAILPNGARWNSEHGAFDGGYYQVEFVDLNFMYSDDYGPDFVGYYADETATYQNIDGQITYVTVIPFFDQFAYGVRQLLEQRVEAQVLGEAGSGEEAIRLTDDLRPDVVLMDFAMPRMNGLEATRQLKTRWLDLTVVILTGHDEDVYRRTAIAAGATAFMQKKMLGVDNSGRPSFAS